MNGVWGTLALGIFYDNQIATDVAALATGLSPMAQVMVQLKGVVYVGAFTLGISLAFWYAIKFAIGLRVSPEEEIEGLDIGEHGSPAYPDFAAHGSSRSDARLRRACMARSAPRTRRPEPSPGGGWRELELEGSGSPTQPGPPARSKAEGLRPMRPEVCSPRPPAIGARHRPGRG